MPHAHSSQTSADDPKRAGPATTSATDGEPTTSATGGTTGTTGPEAPTEATTAATSEGEPPATTMLEMPHDGDYSYGITTKLAVSPLGRVVAGGRLYPEFGVEGDDLPWLRSY